MFYDEDNKNSHDSNHAVLSPERISDLGRVLSEITAFYRAKNIAPTIYHPLEQDYFKKNAGVLSAHGYSIAHESDHRVFVLSEKSSIAWRGTLEVRRVTKWDNRIAEDILIPNGEEHEVPVSMEKLKREGNYLFVGYCGKKAVVYADFYVSPFGCTRFDYYIVTAKGERGKGYARQLMHRISEFCREQKFPLCSAWFANETSKRLNIEAGFLPTDLVFEAGYATFGGGEKR